MSVVEVINVVVLDNPAPFYNPFQLEITFQCLAELKDDLELKLVYVGSASSDQCDQHLDTILVGPVPLGVNKVVFQADPPKPDLIPADDIIGMSAIFLSMSYKDQEFVRVGYYISTDYADEELRQRHADDETRAKIQFDKLVRDIVAKEPRITKFSIDWGDIEPATPAQDEITLGKVFGAETDMVVSDVIDDEMMKPCSSSY